jgi:hypothetical protein
MARYTPNNVPTDAASLAAFLRDELSRIAQAMDTADATLALDTLYAPPSKFREGTLCKADGTIWNPGSGAGVYCYRAAAWRFLG